MLKEYLKIGAGLILILVGLHSYNMSVESKIHYFANGIWVGIGICSVIIGLVGVLRASKQKV